MLFEFALTLGGWAFMLEKCLNEPVPQLMKPVLAIITEQFVNEILARKVMRMANGRCNDVVNFNKVDPYLEFSDVL